jgi:hypothetical protein
VQSRQFVSPTLDGYKNSPTLDGYKNFQRLFENFFTADLAPCTNDPTHVTSSEAWDQLYLISSLGSRAYTLT